jgi:hypothetical protein
MGIEIEMEDGDRDRDGDGGWRFSPLKYTTELSRENVVNLRNQL